MEDFLTKFWSLWDAQWALVPYALALAITLFILVQLWRLLKR